jgi:hypothetical protein
VRRLTALAAVVTVALLVMSAQPAAAANVTASEHTTFGTGSQGNPTPASLTNATVEGSGTSASVAFQGNAENDYNPFVDEGDASAELFNAFIGDRGDGRLATEARIQPTFTGEIDSLTFTVSDVDGGYNADVDVYVVQETPDGVTGEGTKVADISPSFTTGSQTFTLDTPYAVTSGTDYTVEFVTTNTDNDAAPDRMNIEVDDSASATWYRKTATDGTDTSYSKYVNLQLTEQPTDSGVYVGATHDASDVTTGEVDLTLSDAEATVRWQEDGDNDGNWDTVSTATYTGSGTKSQSLSGTNADRWRAVVDFSTNSPATATAELDAERVIYDNQEPEVSNADPSGSNTIRNYDGDISATVRDSDFATAQGDTVTVTATNDDSGSQIGQTSVTANQTVDFAYSPSSGTNSISWTVTDDAGASDTLSQQFTAPQSLKIFNASEPDQLVSGSSNEVTLQFYGSGDTVITETTTTGELSLGSIPAAPEEGYEVAVQPAGDYEPRRVVIQSLIQQQSIYLLPTNTSRSQIEFSVDDRTGEFSQPTLLLERPITKDFDGDSSNETRYVRAAGQQVSAAGTVTTTLENGVRYQIRLRNADGNERVLGTFTPTRAQTVTLTVGELSFEVRQQSDQTFNASASTVKNQNGTITAVRFNYRDPSNETSKVNVTVRTVDGRVLGTARGLNGPYGEFSFTQAVSDPTNDSYVVEFNATKDGTVASGQLRPGARQLPPGVPLKPGLKNLFAIGLILMVGGLFSASNARVGAVVTPLFAGGLWVVDWLPSGVTILAIALALGVGILVNYTRRT